MTRIYPSPTPGPSSPPRQLETACKEATKAHDVGYQYLKLAKGLKSSAFPVCLTSSKKWSGAYAPNLEITKHSMENVLPQLKCHFTWNLNDEEISLDDLEDRGGKYYERAECFEKALEKTSTNPEYSLRLAITLYCLGDKAPTENTIHLVRKAMQLNPDNWYINVLLALTLQKIKKETEEDKLVEEASNKTPCPTDVLRSAAKYYQNKGTLHPDIELLNKALESVPNDIYQHLQIGCCYRAKIRQIEINKVLN
ncbi:Interferon-induced protein with tetratricopeptide repeats 3 [Camelus dromedarius]|uniref:Interferon-induced protein with tetratricopeptide repeats 3 n=1 Tax=Camelus dromedarius TaxID=9838 RepID=A0A5N4DJB6_CAMDR|nr:Interferon-induced protein with tetratricopeptide repeats 3 [Camelus dromedarius]